MAKKRGCLGCSFPVLIVLIVLFTAVIVIGFLAGAVGKAVFPNVNLPEWLSVSRPQPELPGEVAFNLFGFPIRNTVTAAWVTMAFLVLFSYIITRRMKIIPGRLQGVFEFLLGWLYDFCKSVAGEENGRRFFPIVATIFLFVSFNGWLSLIPGYGSITILNPDGHHVHLLRGANTDVNMPLALAFISFFFVEFFGLRILGIRYISKFLNFGPLARGLGQVFSGKIKEGLNEVFIGFIHFFVGILEGLSELIRILSFTFRLFGNMTAGEILLIIVAFLLPFVVGLPFYMLELLVGFVQALIFGGLTLVFLTLATAHHGEETHA